MKLLWYGFLSLLSLGFLGLLVVIVGIGFVFNYYGQDLPDYTQLKNYEPPIVTRLYAGDGRLMAEFAQEKRVFVPIHNMPDLVKNAFIAAEDQNFYKHEGVDPTAIARALFIYAEHALGKNVAVVGGSTITQQVVKNFLLTNERSFERKIKEAILANRMEQAMSKDRILELYLNQIYLGARSYGVAAAALQYFNKSLEELTIPEVAYLAALPKAPNNYNPVRQHDAALARRNWVITRMQEDDYVTAAEAESAKATPLAVVDQDGAQIVQASYFAEEVRRKLGEQYGEDSLYKGGLAVRTTIDPALQDLATKALQKGLMAYDQRHGYRGPYNHFENMLDWEQQLAALPRPQAMLEDWALAVVLETQDNKATLGFASGAQGTLPLSEVTWARKYLNEGYSQGPEITAMGDVLQKGDVILVAPVADPKKKETYALRQIPDVQGAIIALDPHTGRILAMQGGWTYTKSEYNRATQAKRQPGSSFKPFVYLAALESGLTPATLIRDAPFVIQDRPGHFWSPTNYHNDYYGPTPLRIGIEKSRNLMTVRLADYLGMDKIIAYADRFGIDHAMPPNLSNALGAGETILLNITSAYAELVNGGKKITPSFIDRIQDRRGTTIFQHDARACANCGKLIRWEGQAAPDVPDTREQIADPRTAYQMVSILQGVVERGTATKLKDMERPIAGKTGTTNESKDTWFIGFSPDLVAGVFVGFDNPRSLGKRETGASVALPVFKDFMEGALKDAPILPFRVPAGIKNVQINARTGARAKAGDADVLWEAFLAGTEPTEEPYILEKDGVHVFNGGEAYNPVSEAASTDGDSEAYQEPTATAPYDAPYSGPYLPPQETPLPNPAPSQPVPPTDTGTGGLY